MFDAEIANSSERTLIFPPALSKTCKGRIKFCELVDNIEKVE